MFNCLAGKLFYPTFGWKFQLIKMRLKVWVLRHTGHICSAQWPHGTAGCVSAWNVKI